MGERKEILGRIFFGIICEIIVDVWKLFIALLWIVQFFIVLFTGKRNKEVTRLQNHWVSYIYRVYRYVNFTTKKRPWPFVKYQKVLEKVD